MWQWARGQARKLMLHSSRNENEQLAEDSGLRDARGGGVAGLNIDPSWRAGRKLAEARKQRGWTQKDVADKIRVRVEYLQSLEAMNIKQLPGKAYALAYLRSYAKALGLNSSALAEQFKEECALSREDAQAQIRDPKSKPHRERPWIVAAAILLVAVTAVSWRVFYGGDTVEASVASDVRGERPVRAAVVYSAQPSLSVRQVEIRALSEAWLEARGPDGTVFLSRVLQQGDLYRPDPSPGWTLHARDGGAFEVYVDGASAGLLGALGAPVLGRPIDEIEPSLSASTAR